MSTAPRPLGPEEIAHTVTTDRQYNPVIAAFPDGGYALVYGGLVPILPGTTFEWHAFVRFHDADGLPLGPEIQITDDQAVTAYFAHKISAIVLADDTLLVVWSNGQTGFGQTFAPDGTPVSDGPFAFYGLRDGDISGAYALAPLADGGFAMAASEFDSVTGHSLVMLRQFNADGSARPAETRLIADLGDSGQPSLPYVARDLDLTALDNGNWLLSWGRFWGPSQAEQQAQIVAADGTLIGDLIDLRAGSTAIGQFTTDAKIAARPDGGFAAVWGDSPNGGTNPKLGINLRLFDATGSALGDSVLVSETPFGDQSWYDIATMPDGGFLVVWAYDFVETEVRGQRYDRDGVAIGGNFAISVDYPAGVFTAEMDIKVMADGRFVVAWKTVDMFANGGEGEWDIYSRAFGPQTFGGAADETFAGDTADDWIAGRGGDDVITGLDGNDSLFGDQGHDGLDGGDGDDSLTGGAGNDTIRGGTGTDLAAFALASTAVNAMAVEGGLILTSDEGVDFVAQDVEIFQFTDRTLTYAEAALLRLIRGTDLAENVNGTEGSERIEALGGNDWITPGTGSDTIDGGAGRDMVSFVNLPDTPGRTNVQYRLDLDLTAGTATTSGPDVYELRNIERVTGTIYADRIKGSAGDDELRGLGDYDWFIATTGADTYDGGTGMDMVSYFEWAPGVANDGIDPLTTNGRPPGAADVPGVIVDLANTANNTNLAAGHTYVSIERITGTSWVDVFWGDGNENDFRGLGGFDWFVGSTGGRERYFGGDGTDTVTYFNSASGITASLMNGARVNGQETGYGTAGDAARDLYFEIENLVGTSHNDRLTGNSGRNTLMGLEGDDFLFGGAGIDLLHGGAGNDTIDGGAGSDYAIFTGNRDLYTLIKTSSTTVTVNGPDGTDSLINVEYFRFDDMELNIWGLNPGWNY